MRLIPAGQRGQASLEVIALLPVLIVVAIAAVYVAGLLASAGQAQDRARRAALAATGEPGAVVTVTVAAQVRGPIMGLATGGRSAWHARAAVRLP